jgi:flagellar hook-basal body complex protein FliE
MKIGSLPIPQPRELQQLYDAARTRGPQQAGELNPAEGLAGAQMVGGAGKAEFSNLLERAVTEVNGKMQAADTEKTKLFTGETDNLHQAMIAMQEASVAFSLMVEVRNKLVEGYQEIMRMQV